MVVALLALSTPATAQSQSANFRLMPATIDAAGAPAAGAGHRSNGSLGQSIAVGTSSAPHFVVQSGFWSFTGSTLVPVVLAANKVPAQPGAVGLSWSGNNASYDVYRAPACAAVFGSVYAATSALSYTDTAAPSSGLACYNVLAVAPGPIPPAAGAPAP